MMAEEYPEDVQQLIDEIATWPPMDVHGWFGLTYVSWLTLPRVLMQAMSEEWQHKMVELLDEYDSAFPNQPDYNTSVHIKQKGKFAKMPDWINYRRPDKKAIDKMRKEAGK